MRVQSAGKEIGFIGQCISSMKKKRRLLKKKEKTRNAMKSMVEMKIEKVDNVDK